MTIDLAPLLHYYMTTRAGIFRRDVLASGAEMRAESRSGPHGQAPFVACAA